MRKHGKEYKPFSGFLTWERASDVMCTAILNCSFRENSISASLLLPMLDGVQAPCIKSSPFHFNHKHLRNTAPPGGRINITFSHVSATSGTVYCRAERIVFQPNERFSGFDSGNIKINNR
jgi:hypothetical protein